VQTYARILPIRDWVLVKGPDGQLMASTFNHETGLSDGYRLSNFDRGTSIAFSLRPTVLPGQQVAQGDTIGSIYSSEIQERMTALEGELAAAQSQLAVSASGAKAAVVDEAQKRLEFAQRRKKEHDRVLERAERLRKSDLISQGELEHVENETHALDDDIQIAKSNLEAARSGAKPEQLSLLEARVAALKNEIASIQQREATYTLVAPISGTIARSFSADTLVTIVDVTTLVALVPIPWADSDWIRATPDPQITAWGLSAPAHGSLTSFNLTTRFLHGERVVLAAGTLHDAPANLTPGMLTKCAVRCESTTAFERMKQYFASQELRSVTLGWL
jgi:hypothetical protein